MRIAVTANLNAGTSVHSATFQRAVRMAAEWLAEERRVVELLWVDDQASAAGALAAARQILSRSVQAVVGHYASDAALAAAPLYRAAGIPLFLPAATASRLSGLGYRLCDPDEDYVEWLAAALRPYGVVYIESDGSVHGRSIEAHLSMRVRRVFSAARARAVLFSGRFEASLAYCRAHLARRNPRPLMLTDDAQTVHLARALDIRDAPIRIFGFDVRPPTALGVRLAGEYHRRFAEEPGVYFFETVAAMQVAARWTRSPPPSFATVLGEISFDACGESRPRRFACYRPAAKALVRVEEREFA